MLIPNTVMSARWLLPSMLFPVAVRGVPGARIPPKSSGGMVASGVSASADTLPATMIVQRPIVMAERVKKGAVEPGNTKRVGRIAIGGGKLDVKTVFASTGL